MKFPIHFMAHEVLKERGSLTDTDLLTQINNRVEEPITMRDLNKALLHLEINGLATVSWISKDQRRIELQVSEATPKER